MASRITASCIRALLRLSFGASIVLAACTVDDTGAPLPPPIEEDGDVDLGLEDPVRVLRVIDGDTLEIDLDSNDDGEPDHVRMKGIDTPELFSDPGPQPFAEAARDYTLSHVGTDVELVFDSGCQTITACRDAYDRILAYVKLSNGGDLAAQLLSQGLARVYVFHSEQFDRRAQYEALSAEAQDAELGLWGDAD